MELAADRRTRQLAGREPQGTIEPARYEEVRDELVRRLRRAVAPEVLGARADYAAIGRELARRERGVLELGDAHSEIEPLFDEIDGAIREAERQLDLRVALREARHERRNLLVPE